MRVELSSDGARTWSDAELVPVSKDPFAWTQWRAAWDASAPGIYELACRATDADGNVQPVDPQQRWNRQGMGINGVQRLRVTVQAGIGSSGDSAPSVPHAALVGGKVPPTR